MKKPVALLLFANDIDSYLDRLQEELIAVENALYPYEAAGFIHVHNEAYVTKSRFLELLHRYRGQIFMVHYAGHANGQSLSFEDSEAQGTGFSDLLQGVSVVFLNGCATQGHVESLQNNGVQHIIATQVAANDNQAFIFAKTFYTWLADRQVENGVSLEKAFDEASKAIRLDAKAPKIRKGLKLRRDNFDNKNWGLYSSAEGELQKWYLPTTIIETVSKTDDIDFESPNDLILEELFTALANHIDEVHALAMKIEAADDYEQYVHEIYEAIRLHYLAPISLHITKLFSIDLEKAFSEQRLRQLAVTYQQTLTLVSSIMMSQLWDEIHSHNAELELTDSQRQVLTSFFNKGKYSHDHFDYFELIETLHSIFKQRKMSYYMSDKSAEQANGMEEMVLELIAPNSDWRKAEAFFQSLKKPLQKDISAKNVKNWCQKGEYHLAKVLASLYFVSDYKMVVVKYIKLNQRKHGGKQYIHTIVELDNDRNKSQRDIPKTFEEHTDSEAIILYKNQPSKGLNLSPFVIDENILRQQNGTKLHYYLYQENHDKYYFQFADNHKDLLEIPEKNKFKFIAKLMQQARKDLLGIKEKPKEKRKKFSGLKKRR